MQAKFLANRRSLFAVFQFTVLISKQRLNDLICLDSDKNAAWHRRVSGNPS